MTPAAEPQRQTKRSRTERTQFPTILPPTERARLAALNVHTGTAEPAVSSSSTASAHTWTSGTTPRPQEPPAAPHTATPISTPSVHPCRNGSPTTVLQRHSECPHGPPHTLAYAAGGTQGCELGATAVNVATTPPALAAQVLPGEPDAAHAEFPTRAAMQARSAGSVLRRHDGPGVQTPTTNAALTGSLDSETFWTTPSHTERPSLAPLWPGPTAENMHTKPGNNASGDTPSPGTLAARDREIMVPPPPRPPHSGDHLDLEELRRAYDVYHRTPSDNLVDALRAHFQGARTDRRFAAALLSHGATNMRVGQLRGLLTLGQRTPDDLIDVWIWWFKYHQADNWRIWVPHLAWAHMLIAPPTEPQPAANPGGRTQAAPQLIADALNIPPYDGLAYWESRTAR